MWSKKLVLPPSINITHVYSWQYHITSNPSLNPPSRVSGDDCTSQPILAVIGQPQGLLLGRGKRRGQAEPGSAFCGTGVLLLQSPELVGCNTCCAHARSSAAHINAVFGLLQHASCQQFHTSLTLGPDRFAGGLPALLGIPPSLPPSWVGLTSPLW
jgi:hypothetical protein